jgi:hypothetical protein
MKTLLTALRVLAALTLVVVTFSSCESTDEGTTHVSGGVYYGAGFYDPWYYGGYYPPDVIVTPPPDRPDAPLKPTHPIANPPPAVARPMPSIPSMPRPALRR